MKNIIIKNLDKITDIQSYLEKLNTKKNLNKRFFIEYQNNLFKESNWLDKNDIKNLLTLSGYQFIAIKKDWIIARIKTVGLNKLSVSIVIPARNEARNIPGIIKSIPYFGKSQEIIFVEGGSKDDTWLKIQAEIKTNKIKANPESILVAVKDGVIVGNVCIINYGSKLQYLFRLAVDKDYRNQGIATQLINSAVDIARKNGVNEVGLYADADNSKLLAYYSKRGFKKSKSRYYYMWQDIK